MRNLLRIVASLLIAISSLITPVFATSIQMGVSVDIVPVGSDFDGTDVILFGSIEGVAVDALNRGEYDVVIKVSGKPEDVIIREKERKFGIWVNAHSRVAKQIPSFYTVLSQKPITDIASKEVLSRVGIGIENLGSELVPAAERTFVLNQGPFSDALKRIRTNGELYYENPSSLTQLSPSLFRAKLSLPPNVPIGKHTVTAHLFRDGQHLFSKSADFQILKIGFEKWIYNLAHKHGFIYGLLAVFIAIFTGWAANYIFRKN